MSFVLVVRMRAKAGAENRVAEIARELGEASRAEPGCEQYVACRDPEDPGAFLFFEQYRDRAAFEEHGASEHFTRLAAGELWDLLESRDRTFYETV
jgi:quinol monooxygenase YgiN